MAEQQGYGLLKGKKGIIFGALDERSIAWRIALACQREGAEFALSNAPVALRLGALDDLAEKTGASVYPCDVSKEDEVEDLMQKVKDEYGKIDFMLHAIGMSPNIRKNKEYKELNYHWYQQTLDISAVSLHKILHFAEKKEILNDGSSIVALSYIGAQRIFSKYSDMNDAKALLESIARNYASRLADRGIRVNTVSQAPTQTSAGSGIKGFDGMYTFADKLAPMGNPSADECADYCVTLFSDLTRKVTMQNLYHDGGFVNAGVNEEMIEGLAKLYGGENEDE
ncbi:enoyl-ACP reductase [Balneolaceae bacterium YR4-1]|uniref:Enoyl-[acyl-carrier-protein] reductase [NADH] n=1 Tax=Halalkalibaculum roseum TaxID=2709311 RepID=A0A6M1T2I3_9BACT|nr:enoyl-ACP reductase [Halalkalibaculum roseum]NGP77724.1 enoyl-ACP reductase [Halalkalibaculum roseum]